jgi:hypothetical protein
MVEIINSLESSAETVVYALGETKVCVELDNHLSWSTIDHPPVLEKSGAKQCINIVGSTCVLSGSHTVNDVYPYPAKKSITSMEVKSHLEYLIEINEGKNVCSIS